MQDYLAGAVRGDGHLAGLAHHHPVEPVLDQLVILAGKSPQLADDRERQSVSELPGEVSVATGHERVEQLLDLGGDHRLQGLHGSWGERLAQHLLQFIMSGRVHVEEIARPECEVSLVDVNPSRIGERLPVACRSQHIGIAREHPQAPILVVVDRRCFAQLAVHRVGILIERQRVVVGAHATDSDSTRFQTSRDRVFEAVCFRPPVVEFATIPVGDGIVGWPQFDREDATRIGRRPFLPKTEAFGPPVEEQLQPALILFEPKRHLHLLSRSHATVEGVRASQNPPNECVVLLVDRPADTARGSPGQRQPSCRYVVDQPSGEGPRSPGE